MPPAYADLADQDTDEQDDSPDTYGDLRKSG
ncbi:hypothetical protein JOF54_001869 [Microlunatus capsulatus]|uniref:Uncharacterized protein n=1 Tax=Microlunatus capsulatus TaxID=99117 RepID=A0ABS4Z7C3_9ACTN|nr:hypothetical protein [Microlunatus capsulatus]